MRYSSVGFETWRWWHVEESEGRRVPFQKLFPCVLVIIFYSGNSDKFYITPLARSQVVKDLWPVPQMNVLRVPAPTCIQQLCANILIDPTVFQRVTLCCWFFSPPLLKLVERLYKTQQGISQPPAFQMATLPIPTVSGGSRWPQGKR